MQTQHLPGYLLDGCRQGIPVYLEPALHADEYAWMDGTPSFGVFCGARAFERLANEINERQKQMAAEQAIGSGQQTLASASAPVTQHTYPRRLDIEELDGGFVVNAYDTRGYPSRFVAHNARVLGRKLKAWADPTPAVPPVTEASA